MSEYLTDSIENFVRYMRQRRFSQNTINQYVGYVEKISEIDTRIYRLSNKQIQTFILESNSGSTQNCKINALKLFFKINHPKRRINVFIRPKREKKLIEVLSVDEMWSIIDSISHVKQKAIISGIYLHGLRRSEILELKYENIDRDRGLLIIRNGKGKKDRLVPLNELWLDFLAIYAREKGHKKVYDKPIFYPYSTSSISSVIKSKAKQLGIKKRVYPHLMRDCYATHLLQQGVDIKFIQEILGHSKVTTTEKYIHISACDISKIALKKVS